MNDIGSFGVIPIDLAKERPDPQPAQRTTLALPKVETSARAVLRNPRCIQRASVCGICCSAR
jgi:hypothetical protein